MSLLSLLINLMHPRWIKVLISFKRKLNVIMKYDYVKLCRLKVQYGHTKYAIFWRNFAGQKKSIVHCEAMHNEDKQLSVGQHDELECPTWAWVKSAWGFTLTRKGPDFVHEISPNMGKCDRTLKECKYKTDPQSFSLGAQAFGAHLHHRIRTERHSYFILTDRRQPQRRIGLQLQRRN